MVLATNLGFPRIGVKRELKKATEGYWKGNISGEELLAAGKDLRMRHWEMQRDAGLDQIPSNDFSFYDQMLDMACLLGCVPSRYNWQGGDVDIDTYFAMARGDDNVPAMEMTKWFDTNYHYIVPEFEQGMNFALSSSKVFDEFAEALEAGITTRPVLIGPVTFLLLGKAKGNLDKDALLEEILPVYTQVLNKLKEQGAQWVQIDEPCLVLDLEDEELSLYRRAYEQLAEAAPGLNILLATYFEGIEETRNIDVAVTLPVQGLHIDLCRGSKIHFEEALAKLPDNCFLSLGVVDGRNIWKNDLSDSLEKIELAVKIFGGEHVMIAPGCSLLHCPVDLDQEDKLDPQIKSWMAFSRQKLDEIAILTKGANEGREAIERELAASNAVKNDRNNSERTHGPEVRQRMADINPDMMKRKSDFAARRALQQEKLQLPLFPTTSIGSFPQTQGIRKARSSFKKGLLSNASYKEAMKKEIAQVVRFQEEICMDVLVHGEAERNDMVEYFGEQLDGFTFTRFGWVQSYGSRYVKPPVIFGDISRPQPMTVEWSSYAQSLTDKPMKGMLTGPVTILQWSFVRDDQPRSQTCNQIALAIRDEVTDLERADIGVIQIDEPAIREGLPLRKEDWNEYLGWAVDAFRLSSSGVKDETQIHTHMCYSEFNDIIDSIGAMDADVISIETSRSQMELLDAFVEYKYPNDIGPGVYDIHSPRVPTVEEMTGLLSKAQEVLEARQIWVNPDCGLKTRAWEEVDPSLRNMVAAAKEMRQKVKSEAE
jgi:5-methyltetrahydropteroyltriglutamate--homocysteine methyltransferase